jgi:hypothetical protein
VEIEGKPGRAPQPRAIEIGRADCALPGGAHLGERAMRDQEADPPLLPPWVVGVLGSGVRVSATDLFQVAARAIEVVGEIVARVRILTEPCDARFVEPGSILILMQPAAEMTSPLPELLAPGRLLLGPPGRARGATQGQMVDPLQPVDRLVLPETSQAACAIQGLVVLRERRVRVFERRGAGLEVSSSTCRVTSGTRIVSLP